MTTFLLYLLTRCDYVHYFFLTMLGIVGVVGGLILADTFLGFSQFGHDPKKIGKSFVVYIITTGLLSLGVVLTPTNKDLATIIVGNWINNDKEIKKLPDNVLRTLNNILEEYNGEKK